MFSKLMPSRVVDCRRRAHFAPEGGGRFSSSCSATTARWCATVVLSSEHQVAVTRGSAFAKSAALAAIAGLITLGEDNYGEHTDTQTRDGTRRHRGADLRHRRRSAGRAKDKPANALLQVPVTGTTSNGGTFQGTATITDFAVDGKNVVATGTIVGIVNGTQSIVSTFSAPIALPT